MISSPTRKKKLHPSENKMLTRQPGSVHYVKGSLLGGMGHLTMDPKPKDLEAQRKNADRDLVHLLNHNFSLLENRKSNYVKRIVVTIKECLRFQKAMSGLC